VACIIFPDEEYTLTASLHKQKKDMSLYHVHLKDKFKDAKSVSLEEFLKYDNNGLFLEFIGDSTVFDILNEGVHSRSLQMLNRNNILDYVQPEINTISIPSQIINNSLLNLSNIPVNDIVSILENFNKKNNIYYKMLLREGEEQICREQTATDEEKKKINGLNNV
jgi:hypothetical protein